MSVSYRVPSDVLQSLRMNKPYVCEQEPIVDTQAFFDRFDRLMHEMNDNEQTHDSLKILVKEMLEEISSSAFARGLRTHKLCDDDLLLFIFMAHLYVENNDDCIGFHDIDDLFDNDEIPSWCKRELRTHSSQLFSERLIENVSDDGMARSDAYKLTEQAKEDLLGELNLGNIGKSDKGLVKAESLTEKSLVYNDSERDEIAEVSSIL